MKIPDFASIESPEVTQACDSFLKQVLPWAPVESVAVVLLNELIRRQIWQPSDTTTDLAHALRTPLSSIKGYSSSLLQTDITWEPEVRREFLETIDREADQTRLTQTLVYLVTCAANATSEDVELQVRALNFGDRFEVVVGALETNVSRSNLAGRKKDATFDRDDSPIDPLDDALRLAACRTVVEAHGAEFELDRPGEWGNMFCFELPVYTA